MLTDYTAVIEGCKVKRTVFCLHNKRVTRGLVFVMKESRNQTELMSKKGLWFFIVVKYNNNKLLSVVSRCGHL